MLKQIAQANSWPSWGKFETAVLQGKIKLPHPLKGVKISGKLP